MQQQITNEDFSEPPAKRPRGGRPFGSKNKPKPASFLRPHVLEISAGGDIAEAMKTVSRGLGGCVSVLTANGPVSSAVLKQPSFSSATDLTLSGCYEIVSMSNSFFAGGGGISVTVAGMNGEIVGGILNGPLVAAGKVVLVVAELSNPKVQFLGKEELDSGQEEEFRGPAMADEAVDLVDGEGGGDDDDDDDEWCRDWFGQCEKEVRRRFDLSRSGGREGGCEGLFLH